MRGVVRQESLAPARVMGLALGVGGLLAVLAGVPMKAVTFHPPRVLLLPIGLSHSIGAASPPAQRGILVAVGAGLAALLVAQVGRLRSAAAVPLVASGAVIAAAFYALDRANGRPGSAFWWLLRYGARPEPAVGFYFMLVGAIAAAVGSLVTLVAPRNTVMVIGGFGVPAREPGTAKELREILPLPDRTPNWHPDPSGGGALRWWDGTRWATEVSGSRAPLPPTGPR